MMAKALHHIIAAYCGPHHFSKSSMIRAKKMVIRDLTERGKSGRSASGWTIAMAINHCEEMGWPYRLIAHPGLGYFLERIEEGE